MIETELIETELIETELIETELIETELIETERLLLRRYRPTDADRVLDIRSWHRHDRAVAERLRLRPLGVVPDPWYGNEGRLFHPTRSAREE